MFDVVIGLEVHVQLNTKSKLFCSCANNFNDAVNSNTCPVCLALPGALPVLNREAVKKAMIFGHGIGATINRRSVFDRKSYFYPDSPSSYQITQFYEPIVTGGFLDIELDNGESKRVDINRAHIESDAGKNVHKNGYSEVDLNRAGTPLIEIVTEPVIYSVDEAIKYLKKLHTLVRYLDISDANMQEGSFRCDANISIRPKGDSKLYTRVEIKNINSFRYIEKALNYEIERQSDAWENGTYEEEVFQETRLYNPEKNITKSMRGKEGSADYRYFPEPDLRPVVVDDELYSETLDIPELPDAKRDRFINELKLKPYDAGVISSIKELADYFEELLKYGASVKNSVTWLTVELLGRLNDRGLDIITSPIKSKVLAELIVSIDNGTISGKAGKDVLDYLFSDSSLGVSAVIDKLGLKQVSDDGAIITIIQSVLSSNGDKVAEYKGGKEKLFGFFVGSVMKESKGSANPAKVNELLKIELGKV